MATAAGLRSQVKYFAGIKSTDTSFDTDIDTQVAYALKNLAPIALKENTSDVTKSVNADGVTIDLPTGTLQIRSAGLELYDNDVSDYRIFTDWRQHGTQIRLNYYVTPGTQARIWPLGYYNADYSDLPQELELVVVYYALSFFYVYLAGNKRKYNIYAATTGAAADHDMKDSAQEWKQEADNLLMDRVTVRGS